MMSKKARFFPRASLPYSFSYSLFFITIIFYCQYVCFDRSIFCSERGGDDEKTNKYVIEIYLFIKTRIEAKE